MNISISSLKEDPSKYFELAKTTEVIVTEYGKSIGRIVSDAKTAKSDKQRAIEALIGSIKFPEEYDDPNFDPDYELLRDEAFREKGLL